MHEHRLKGFVVPLNAVKRHINSSSQGERGRYETDIRIVMVLNTTSFISDQSYIYLLEEDDNEKLVGVVTHNRTKTYAPMFDKVGWK